MTDTPNKKTLTITRTPKPASKPDNPGQRKRSGARARKVAQRELSQPKTPQPLATQPPTPPLVRQTNTPASPETQEKPTVIRQPREPRPRKTRTSSATPAQQFSIFVPCPHGLEAPLCAELNALGFDDATAGRAGCKLQADWTGIMRLNLFSRLATRVLVQLSQAPVRTEDDIYDLAYHTPWERWFGAEQTLRVDTSAIHSPMKSLQFCNLKTKDGICDRLRDREGARPDIDTVRPDARVHLFLDDTSATMYLDTSGESLFKRGWRLDKGQAPIRENLAAGLLALSDWNPDAALLDPFCGSGTILIEAAWVALGVPPGIWRPFSFERLRDHPIRHWRDIKAEAREHIRTTLQAPLVGTDTDPNAIAAARQNLDRARLSSDTVRFEVADARNVVPPAPEGWLITNPSYGERLTEEEDQLWQEWASHLKQNYDNWHVHIISNDLALPKKLRLKPLKRTPLHNGALDCRLFGFEMVRNQYRNIK